MNNVKVIDKVLIDNQWKLVVEMEDRKLNVYIPIQAILNRVKVYALESEDDAVVAILKEHATRELKLPVDKHSDVRIASMGGLRKDVKVEL